MRYSPPFQRSVGLVPVLVSLMILALLPLLFTDSYLRHMLILTFIYAIVASNWDLSLGYGGMFNFAHVALFAVGIYAYGILAKTLGVSPWLAIVAAGFLAVTVAALLALPVLRLDGVYVILITIAFSQLIYQIVISQSDYTGGTSGMVMLPSLAIGDYRFIKDGKIGYYYTALALLAVSTIFLYRTVRGRLGRAMIALRDNKYLAISRGISESRTRLQTLVASAFFTGMAGGLYASYVRVASPDVFGVSFLALLLSMLLVGGAATLWGPIIAAFVLTGFSELIVDLGPWRNIIMAGLIILIMIFYPGGLWAALQELHEFFQSRKTAFQAHWRRRYGKRARENRLRAKETIIATTHCDIAVSDTGGDAGKPVLLFLHGNSSCKEAFQYQFEAFGEGYRVIAFDLPGHGVSGNANPERTYNIIAYAEIAEEILATLGIESLVLFGWSLGGYVALELAARGNVTIRGLAISGTSPLNILPDDFAAGYNASSHLILSGKQHFSRTERRNYANSANSPYSAKSAFLHKNIGRTDGRARAFLMTKLNVIDWPRQMRMLREGAIPFAMFNGSDDPFLNHDYLAGLPYGNIWRGGPDDIKAGGHAPFFNEPDQFNEKFTHFLDWINYRRRPV